MQLMLKFGDEHGKIDYPRLDAEQPDWVKWIGNGMTRSAFSMRTNGFRMNGAFAYFKRAGAEAIPGMKADETKPSSKADRNGHKQPDTAELLAQAAAEAVSDKQREKEIEREVELRLSAILNNMQHCPRCTFPLVPLASLAKLVANQK